MISKCDIDSMRQVSLGSLPEIAKQLCDEQLVGDVISKVKKHYDPTAICLVLEGPTELRIKASYGMSTGKLPLNSITRHVSGRPLPIIIYDAQADERFENDTLVAGPPFARFYVGAPIIIRATDTCVGSLCMMDSMPREEYSVEDCDILAEAAQSIAKHLAEVNMAAVRFATMMTLQSLPPMLNAAEPDAEPE